MSLFGFLSSRMVGISGLVCWRSLFIWAVLCLVISSLIVVIIKSVCRTLFGTYQGALVIALRILFWNLCSISMLEWDAVPHRGIPYVQMGFNIVSCSGTLFLRDSSDFLPIIQYIFLSVRSSCFLLACMCAFHVVFGLGVVQGILLCDFGGGVFHLGKLRGSLLFSA